MRLRLIFSFLAFALWATSSALSASEKKSACHDEKWSWDHASRGNVGTCEARDYVDLKIRLSKENARCKSNGSMFGFKKSDIEQYGYNLRRLTDEEQAHAIHYIDRTSGEPPSPQSLVFLRKSDAWLAYLPVNRPTNGIWFVDAEAACVTSTIYGGWSHVERIVKGTWRFGQD